ncbi:MAG TPA: response regulator, partial [Spirochaetales bacterium]|nr:response regulator [Spirochaetales bacterium]
KAENGLEALESVRKNKPDLIILDNIMPKLSGWEVTKVLKNDPEYAAFSDIPIIMFSALDDVKDKVEGLELGADDYITKPFNFAEVLARIRAVLRTHDLIRQIENRERRIGLAEKAVEDAGQAALAVRDSLVKLSSACEDPDLVRQAASEASARLDEMDRRIAQLRKDSEPLRKAATDLESIRRRLRTAERS